jgi:osmotically-inducible protein OsmY
MNQRKLILVILTLGLVVLAAGCDTTTNTNTANNQNKLNGNAAKENATPTPANTNSSNSNVSKSDVQKDLDKYKQQAKDLGRKIGDGADDGWLWVKTRSTLATADDLRDSTINVDVDNNVVTLTGSVADAKQKERAAQLTKEIEGVKSVKNELRLAGDNSPNATDDKTAPAKGKKP